MFSLTFIFWFLLIVFAVIGVLMTIIEQTLPKGRLWPATDEELRAESVYKRPTLVQLPKPRGRILYTPRVRRPLGVPRA